MNIASRLLTAIAVLACAVIYGTDVFAAIVLRPAVTHLDDRGLTTTMGYVHDYGDRRLPVPGALGLIATILATTAAALARRGAATVAAAAAGVALIVWLLIYGRISAPINHKLTTAAHAGRTPPDARSLQRRWDQVINCPGRAANGCSRRPVRLACPVLNRTDPHQTSPAAVPARCPRSRS